MSSEITSIIEETLDVIKKTMRGKKYRPFDIILAKRNTLLGKFFNILYDDYNQAGIIVNSYVLPSVLSEYDPEELFLLESTISSDHAGDVESGRGEIGVQIRSLERALEEYGDTSILIVKKNPLDKMSIENIRKKLLSIYQRYDGQDIDSGFTCCAPRQTPYFSEFTCLILYEFGIIDMLPDSDYRNVSITKTNWSKPKLISII